MSAPTPALDERSREVLRALIQLHAATGEPVGSETLARTLARAYSSATLRNVMADLERQGYLEHPHTSAGRLPTDEGWRFYVNWLMAHRPLPPQDAADITAALRSPATSPTQVLERASSLLSRLSHNVGFVIAPDLSHATFLRIDLVRLPPPRVLVVLVSADGLVTQKVITVAEELTQDDLQVCANYLNAHYAGQALAVIRQELLRLMREEKALYDSLLSHVVSVGEPAFRPDGGAGLLYLDGTANLMGQPGFEDLERMRALFRTFEEKGRLVRILNACLLDRGLRIVIGHENPDPQLQDLAVVSSGVPGEPGFGLGVLGATRMEYERVTALVEHVARAVQNALSELRP